MRAGSSLVRAPTRSGPRPPPATPRTTASNASSADRALSTSRRAANCDSKTCSAPGGRCAATSSLASGSELVTAPCRISAAAQPHAEQPEPIEQGLALHRREPDMGRRLHEAIGRQEQPLDVLSPARADRCRALYSASRSVAPDCASSPATGTTVWQAGAPSGRSRSGWRCAPRTPASPTARRRPRRHATARRSRSPGLLARPPGRGTPRGSRRRSCAGGASGRARRRPPSPGLRRA